MDRKQNWNLPKNDKDVPNLQELQLYSSNVFSEKENREAFSVIDFEFKGEKLKLSVNRDFDEGYDTYFFEIDYGFCWILKASFCFNLEKDKPVIESIIEKNAGFRDKEELRGIGTAFFEKLLELFQSFANQHDKTFKHIIKKHPDFKKGYNVDDIKLSEDEMSEKWDGIFVEFLTQRNYESNNGDSWSKEYIPKN